jgi:cyclase
MVEIHQLSQQVKAFIQPEGGSSVGVIETPDGNVVIDTTSREGDIRDFLAAVGVTPGDVSLVLITHSHSDHTSGIPLFDCPILSHKLTRQRIMKRGTERSKRQIPTEVFEERKDLQVGGMKIQFIHTGGHTPGSSVVRLPESRILFAGDLIFSDIYPFLNVANVPVLMEALDGLLTFDPRVIVPGHGPLCGKEEVNRQLDYLQTSWARTADHLAQGHTLEEVIADPSYPKYSERGYEQLHTWNIKVMYRQLKKLSD